MKVTIDTFTGKPFPYNCTVFYMGKTVPARVSKHDHTWLHPDRVLPALLAHLNPPDAKSSFWEMHPCWKCREGQKPCPAGHYRNCEFPHARND